MFIELLPILRNRTVMLTIALVNDQAIRVNVIPKRLKEGDSGDCALSTPLTVTGTPEELDREFSGQLVAFTGSVVRLGSNLSEIEATHATAVKAVEAEKKKELENKRKGPSQSRHRRAPPRVLGQKSRTVNRYLAARRSPRLKLQASSTRTRLRKLRQATTTAAATAVVAATAATGASDDD